LEVLFFYCIFAQELIKHIKNMTKINTDINKAPIEETIIIRMFNGKEYIAMRDKENKVHYFDKSNNLSKVEL
jgi:hypothetical protein